MPSIPTLKRLKDGDTVGLIAPAGPVKPEQVADSLALLQQLGFRYQLGKYAFADHGLTAAPVEQRLEDFYRLLEDRNICAIWSLRGGYGSIQLLQQMDYQLWRKNPKLFVGFSDLTALQWALFLKTGLPTLSGLTLTLQMYPDNPHLASTLEILSGERTEVTAAELTAPPRVVREGRGEGVLIGGTLSMMCSLCGTPFWIGEKEYIAFIEDINEPLYRIDRCFHQLALCGFWKNVRGVVLGRFIYEEQSLSVSSLLLPLLPADIPVVEDFAYGHFKDSFPLPMGIPAVLETKPFRLNWRPFLNED